MAQEIADSTLLDTWGSGGNIVEPDISKIIEGWQLGEQPPHEYMNWLQNTFGSKLNHILKNGVASWNNTTQYLAGATVQHNGNVWLCKTTNTNSEPTDANTNWKRIITVESLADLSNDYVATTGNQTIAGVKTFSSTILGSISGNAETASSALSLAIQVGSIDSVTDTKVIRDEQPSSGYYFTSTLNMSSADGRQQITVSRNGEGMKFRGNGTGMGSTGWSAWREVIHDANLQAYLDIQTINATTVTNGVYTTDFTGSNQSKSANGYQKLPGGLIIQWGKTGAVSSGATVTVTFPIAFTITTSVVTCNADYSGTNNNYQAKPEDTTATTATIRVGNATADSVHWIAIGY